MRDSLFPVFSVIMPTYNSAAFVRESLESLISQDFESWECVIVDDCSGDNTISIIDEFCDRDSRFKLIRNSKNEGPSFSRNLAITESCGRYITFLDSDDLWMPRKLSSQYEHFSRTGAQFIFSSYFLIDESGRHLGLRLSPTVVSYSELLKSNVIGCLTAAYDTHYFGKVTMPMIRKRQDFGLWLKLLKSVDFAYGIEEPLAKYRVRSDSVSANKLSAASFTWRLYRDIEKLSFFPALYYFSFYIFRSLGQFKPKNFLGRLP